MIRFILSICTYLLQQHQKSISIFESQIDMFMPRVRMSRFLRVHSTIESPSTTYLTIFPSRWYGPSLDIFGGPCHLPIVNSDPLQLIIWHLLLRRRLEGIVWGCQKELKLGMPPAIHSFNHFIHFQKLHKSGAFHLYKE